MSETISRLHSEIARLREALEDVVNPLGNLKRYADKEGSQLNGMAYSIANDLSFVQELARKALKETEND